MNCCAVVLLLGSLSSIGHCVFPPGSCDRYTNITDTWRNYLFQSSSFSGFPNDDAALFGKWLRFMGLGGDTLIPDCQAGPCGGAMYPIYFPFSYPNGESSDASTGTAYANNGSCGTYSSEMSVVLCPGGFYIYQPSSHQPSSMGFVTYHSTCDSGSCGPLAQCSGNGGCMCASGYEIPPAYKPTPQSYGCIDIDECTPAGICGPNADCNNTMGSYSCTCMDGFTATDPTSAPGQSNECTDIDECTSAGVCGPNADCLNTIGSYSCTCMDGFTATDPKSTPGQSNECTDVDECGRNPLICGPNANCANSIGSYTCTCFSGFEPNVTGVISSSSNPCTDVDECLGGVCGDGGTCTNNIGSFVCVCHAGYRLDLNATLLCPDINECLNLTICGPKSECTNIPGNYTCKCKPGYAPTEQDKDPSPINVCIDVSECDITPPICGPYSNCSNSIGSYFCNCLSGFRLNHPSLIASYSNPCIDIDECSETPGLCGSLTVCTNVPGTFYCSCLDGYYPSTGLVWNMSSTYCESLDNVLNKIKPPEGQTKEKAFLGNMDQQLKENGATYLPDATVSNSISASMEVSGVGPRAKLRSVSSEGDGATGSLILGISDRLVTTIVQPGQNATKRTVTSQTVDLSLETIGPDDADDVERTALSANGNTMQINVGGLAKNNNGSAAVAFMTINGLESLLSHQYFNTENRTEMYSDVITAVLPLMNNTNLTEPVNFTIQHKKTVTESGLVTCVYWEVGGGTQGMGWSVEGCWVAYTNENYTVCTCSHLSTFALIMQIGEPPQEDAFLQWLNRMCVTVGLFFLALAIFTFLLCSWNPKINNTARLHLCLNLFFFQLLMLWNDKYVDQERACKVLAGVLHFLVIASFVWMLLEALQLHLLVRRLSKVQVIQRDGLPRPLLYLIGYGVPFVIVGTSALLYSNGYGATKANVCWLTKERNFNWALTGPVVVILALNWILFCATLWSLRPTLVNMKSGASQSKDTRLVIFKILSQFVILGCTWILGLYQSNLFFQVLFIVLNSQQGTFLYIVHCLLNKEVREEYVKWLTCSFNTSKEKGSVKDVPSVSEDVAEG
ncbi:adgre1 [Pungitius sinensis]